MKLGIVAVIGFLFSTQAFADINCVDYWGVRAKASLSANKRLTVRVAGHRGASGMHYNGTWGNKMYFREGGPEGALAIVEKQVFAGQRGKLTFTTQGNGDRPGNRRQRNFRCN